MRSPAPMLVTHLFPDERPRLEGDGGLAEQVLRTVSIIA